MYELWSCEKGHERVLWGLGGGYVERDKKGRPIRIDNRRCWYCGAYTVLIGRK